MSVNIACSTPGCVNPVIGQCTGHKKTCGRYYCHEHSLGTLCGDCAKQKTVDDQAEFEQKMAQERAENIYKEYLALANKIAGPVTSSKFQYQNKNLIRLGGASILIGIIFFCLFASFGARTGSQVNQTTSGSLACLAPAGLILMGWPIVVIPIAWNNSYKAWANEERQKMLIEVESEKKGFTEFWNAWVIQRNQEQTEKNKQILMGVLTVVGVIAVSAVGAAVSESDYDRTRRAVRDELNRQ